jgi:hypothetical protein
LAEVGEWGEALPHRRFCFGCHILDLFPSLACHGPSVEFVEKSYVVHAGLIGGSGRVGRSIAAQTILFWMSYLGLENFLDRL